MGISFGGINTGLPPNLVEQLIEVEKQPMRNVEVRKAKTDSRLKLVSELDTKMRAISTNIKDLAGTKGFTAFKLDSGDPNVVQGSIDPELVTKGSWNVEVAELPQKAAAITNGFPDKDKTEIGVGYFKFETPQGTREVYISGANSTLEGAAKAINTAGVGVRATVLNDRKDPDAPFKLMIAGDNMGGDAGVKYPTLYFLDGDQDLVFESAKESKNGLIRLDGFDMEVTDLTVTDLIPGVTLDLKQAAPGKIVNISVKEDQQVVSGKLKGFVDSVNEVLSFIQKQNTLNEKSDTTATLGGDSLLRTVENDLRRLIQAPVYGTPGSITRISDLGISFNRAGTLEFKEEKFNQVLLAKTQDVQNFLVGDGFNVGFIPNLKRTLSGLTEGVFSPISNRKRGLEEQIKQADTRLENMERRLQGREKTLRQQFSNLEEKMSRMKSQGAQMAAKLGGPAAENLNFGGMGMT